jgi:UDP-glucose 4-epimerase
MVLPNFVRQALDSAPITVFGTGKQSRCFCDVRDTVGAVLRLIATDSAVGEVVNIGTDQEISIEDLAQRVKERTNSGSPIHYIPYDQAYEHGFEDMQRRVPSLEKLERLVSFRPATPLNEIIDRVVAFFQKKAEEEWVVPAGTQRAMPTLAPGTAAP